MLFLTVREWERFDKIVTVDDLGQEFTAQEMILLANFDVILTDHMTKKEKAIYFLKKFKHFLKKFNMKNFDKGLKKFNQGMNTFDKKLDEFNKDVKNLQSDFKEFKIK